jgi:hypothetical protein
MTDEQIDDVIDTLLVDIDDPEVRLSLAHWVWQPGGWRLGGKN